MPIDNAWCVLKGLPERQISTAPGTVWENKYSETAHPSISDERLADAHLSTTETGLPTEFDEEDSFWDTRRGKWVSLAEAHQDTNRGKNSLLTRIKQLPKRFAIDLGAHDRIENLTARANRDWDAGEGRYAEKTPVGFSRYQRERDDIMRQRNEWANRMSWADANQANEEAQAQMQAGTLEMQPAPQPPDPSKMMMGEPMDIAWGVLG